MTAARHPWPFIPREKTAEELTTEQREAGERKRMEALARGRRNQEAAKALIAKGFKKTRHPKAHGEVK